MKKAPNKPRIISPDQGSEKYYERENIEYIATITAKINLTQLLWGIMVILLMRCAICLVLSEYTLSYLTSDPQSLTSIANTTWLFLLLAPLLYWIIARINNCLIGRKTALRTKWRKIFRSKPILSFYSQWKWIILIYRVHDSDELLDEACKIIENRGWVCFCLIGLNSSMTDSMKSPWFSNNSASHSMTYLEVLFNAVDLLPMEKKANQD